MELFLFSTDTEFAKKAEAAGVDSIIVDWEFTDKAERQEGHNLEINRDTLDDLQSLVKAVSLPITVRVNSPGKALRDEVELALAHGARIIMLPMARRVEEVSGFLNMVGSRAQTLVQIETLPLVDKLREFAALSWDYAYIGLNDLSVARKSPFIWDAVFDGTVENICGSLQGRKFGFGGMTVIGGGDPLPFTLLLHEYIRMGCSIGLLRRCFKKDILDRDLRMEIQVLRTYIEASRKRKVQAVQSDHQRLMDCLQRAGKRK
ncbi:MAG: aldolase/citrate lyase family protein [Candidatus Omnitrophica bacterium]|nr:aldolase/citrate lyase family protein [Candidatus Omnitrophota bacterium]